MDAHLLCGVFSGTYQIGVEVGNASFGVAEGCVDNIPILLYPDLGLNRDSTVQRALLYDAKLIGYYTIWAKAQGCKAGNVKMLEVW